MAAKQGLSAQFSQASEDAKRAVLQRTPWLGTTANFHNSNTTLTIKSSPPRSPEVLQLLSTKSGWLYKRNEQHVWQARWCCVVPHMFLYYFDVVDPSSSSSSELQTHTEEPQSHSHSQQQQSSSSSLWSTTKVPHPSSTTPIPKPTDEQQEAWNRQVKYGYGSDTQNSAPRAGGLGTLLMYGNNNNNNGVPHPSTNTDHAAGGGTAAAATLDSNHNDTIPTNTTAATASSSLPSMSSTPAGIIDLECYSAVNRSCENQLILQLAGDDTPSAFSSSCLAEDHQFSTPATHDHNQASSSSLRQFYFCASSTTDSDEWCQALLQQRHSQIVDERDAYQQVCEGFAVQLQELHDQLDHKQKLVHNAQEECYRVRSGVEEMKRLGWRVVMETLERNFVALVETDTPQPPKQQQEQEGDGTANTTTTPETTTMAKTTIPLSLQQARQYHFGELQRMPHRDLIPALHVWSAYTKSVEDACRQEARDKERLEEQLQQGQHVTMTQLQQVKQELTQKEQEWQEEKQEMQQQLKTLQASLGSAQAQLETTRQDLATQTMEMSMYQTSSKNKLKELTNHKKILKREVIELRKTLEELGSEMSLLKHATVTSKSEVHQERRKTELLERYVDKMERQVQVQQNMMEMMSLGGAGDSVRMMGEDDEHLDDEQDFPHGEYIKTYTFESERTSPHHNGRYNHATTESRLDQDADDQVSRHEELMRRAKQAMVMVETHPPAEDEKSHMSELTEDRTQRNIDSFHSAYEESPMVTKARTPPSFIVGNVVHETSPSTRRREHRGTISGPQSLPPPHVSTSTGRRAQLQRWPSSGSVESTGSQRRGRLSVAQRARMEAEERGGNVIRIRSTSPVLRRRVEAAMRPASSRRTRSNRPEEHGDSSHQSQHSFLSNLGRSLSDALVAPDEGTLTDSSGRRTFTDEDRSRSLTPVKKRDWDRRDKDSPPHSPVHSDANVSTTESLSLQERQQLQRAQQLRFLKEQGLIKDESSLRGGAGAASPKARTTSDASSLLSFPGSHANDTSH